MRSWSELVNVPMEQITDEELLYMSGTFAGWIPTEKQFIVLYALAADVAKKNGLAAVAALAATRHEASVGNLDLWESRLRECNAEMIRRENVRAAGDPFEEEDPGPEAFASAAATSVPALT